MVDGGDLRATLGCRVCLESGVRRCVAASSLAEMLLPRNGVHCCCSCSLVPIASSLRHGELEFCCSMGTGWIWGLGILWSAVLCSLGLTVEGKVYGLLFVGRHPNAIIIIANVQGRS